jgi:hypothetical protein
MRAPGDAPRVPHPARRVSALPVGTSSPAKTPLRESSRFQVTEAVQEDRSGRHAREPLGRQRAAGVGRACGGRADVRGAVANVFVSPPQRSACVHDAR